MSDIHETGKTGEELAAAYLSEKGYEILETNWRFRRYELDIIARKEKTIIVAEVKTRKSLYGGMPEESVTRQKQKSMVRAANAYILLKEYDEEVRFDIISVILKGDEVILYQIEDAFYALM